MKKHYDSRTENTTDVWLTPPEIIKALGKFDLDPASPIKRPWDTAKHHYTEKDDGLSKDWVGRVWLNPPYGNQSKLFLQRLKEHGNGIALLFARSETAYFHDFVWNGADAVFFFKGRLRFYRADGTQEGSAAAPSVLIAYGEKNVEAIRTSGLKGHLVLLCNSSQITERRAA